MNDDEAQQLIKEIELVRSVAAILSPEPTRTTVLALATVAASGYATKEHWMRTAEAAWTLRGYV